MHRDRKAAPEPLVPLVWQEQPPTLGPLVPKDLLVHKVCLVCSVLQEFKEFLGLQDVLALQ